MSAKRTEWLEQEQEQQVAAVAFGLFCAAFRKKAKVPHTRFFHTSLDVIQTDLPNFVPMSVKRKAN